MVEPWELEQHIDRERKQRNPIWPTVFLVTALLYCAGVKISRTNCVSEVSNVICVELSTPFV